MLVGLLNKYILAMTFDYTRTRGARGK
jgi:hypothetical protein